MADVIEAGAPPKYNAEEIAKIKVAFENYIDTEDDPTVVGFTSSYKDYDVRKTYMCSRQEFTELVKKAIEKQEAYLLSGAIRNKLNPTMAIFRLKQPQHGYTDKQERENTHTIVTPIMKLEEATNAILGNDSNPED